MWVLATDYDSYSLIYYCQNVEDDKRLVWSAKHSKVRELNANAVAAINETMEQHNVLVNSLYVPVDQSVSACFHYPDQTTDEIILPGQCDTNIPVLSSVDNLRITGIWYQIEKYPDGTQGGTCVGTRFTEITDNSNTLQVLYWEVQDGELVTSDGTATIPADGSGRLTFTMTVPGTNDTATRQVYILDVEYASHILLYSCSNINEFQRVASEPQENRWSSLSIDTRNQRVTSVLPAFWNGICDGRGLGKDEEEESGQRYFFLLVKRKDLTISTAALKNPFHGSGRRLQILDLRVINDNEICTRVYPSISVRSWKLSRTRHLSADSQTAINAVIATREELYPPYFNEIDQDEECLEPDAAFIVKSSLIVIFTCLIIIFTS
ncbi:hypothetical protein EVAR_7927_1 [Eumeta japonica]|uniref:Uncharacterized protein n=1 Tax=Eumeta variegata TaxID=151549 RepID=A0A4C1TVM3_EUMVA|nr:hypothetical protein EVAR_7927_1 [Eumeta japonica]